jgi:integrase
MTMTTAARDRHLLAMEKMVETLSAQLAAQSAQLAAQSVAHSAQLAALAPQWPEHTVAELFEAAFESQWKGIKSEKWLRWVAGKHILPVFGSLQLREITAHRVEAFAKTLKTFALRNRVVATMKIAWNMARRWDWVPANINPFKAIERLPEAPRERALTVAERVAFERARAYLEANSRRVVSRRACRAFRLSLLCAFRPAEAFGLRRDAIDWERRTATLVVHKTDKHVGPRVVPLPRQAIELLRDTPPVGDSPYFFPGRAHGPISDVRKSFLLICKHAGIKNLQIRDLRRTWGTAALERGEQMKAISLQLGHTTIATTEKHYAHLKLEKQAEVADRMGDL